MVMKGIKCSLSNHNPLMLESKSINWGPKPFRSLDSWFSHLGFTKLVEQDGRFGADREIQKLKQPLR